MSYIDGLIKQRNIPSLLNGNGEIICCRDAMKDAVSSHIYGNIPKRPEHMSVDILDTDTDFCAGKATLAHYRARLTDGASEFSFTFASVMPNKSGKHPIFIHIGDTENIPNRYLPAEELIDRGYGCFTFSYGSVTMDNADFKDGCARYLMSARRSLCTSGKLAIWAWAAMRVMDYAESRDDVDKELVAVIGHSFLGKASLLAGAMDERFQFVISNGSGCMGAALTRGKKGEGISDIASNHPHWFCREFSEQIDRYYDKGIDQNMLLALCCPRHLLVSSSTKDPWSDYASEFLCLASVNSVYKLFGINGLIHSDQIPIGKTYLGDGHNLYHLREGTSYLSREDYNAFMDFIDKYR